MTSNTVVLAAGVPQRMGIGGDYFHVLTAPVNDLLVRFDDGKQTPAFKGVGYRVYYDAVELESATGQTVVVLAGFGSVFDGRASANVSVSSTIAPGATLNNGGDVVAVHSVATQLIAQDAARLYALIGNPSSNTQTMRIGGAGVTGSKGVLLEPGCTLPMATSAAIYAYNPHASLDETLTVMSVEV
jgi:hypothetical protein